MDLCELKREISELKREISEATRELGQLQKAKEEVGKEVRDLIYYQNKEKGIYQNKIISGQTLEKKIGLSESDLQKLEIQKKDILQKLEDEILEKTKSLNSFKDSKKDFTAQLKKQGIELQQREKELDQMSVELSNEQLSLKEKNIFLEKGLTTAQKREKVANDLKAELNATRRQLERETSVVKADLIKIELVKQKKEQELEKQQDITKKLNNQLKVLELKIEAQDKRELPLKNLAEDLKKREAKLRDDRSSLQRAIAEKLNK